MARDPVTFTYLDSPVGTLLIARGETGLREIRFPRAEQPAAPEPAWTAGDGVDADAAAQFDAYFRGERTSFNLPIAPIGTPFQKAVWALLCEIPYGRTVTYGELACRLGNPKSVRAVGAANGRNPLPIIVPCHRVIGSDGSLTGYAGGLVVKEALLRLEGASFKPSGLPSLFDVL